MTHNPTQIQKDFSKHEFNDAYGRLGQCGEALHQARWPNGLSARVVGMGISCKLGHCIKCAACRPQTSLIAITVFQDTKLAL